VQKKPLIETNPYLRGTDKARKALITNVSSNTSIETGRSTEAIARDLSRSRSSVKTRPGSGR
jgi:hypothetical protein